MSPAIILRRVATELGRYVYAVHDEQELQVAVAKVIEAIGLPYRREVQQSKRDRFDLLVDDAVVIEVKANGSFAEAALQASRYAEHDVVRAIVLASSRAWPECGHEFETRGKPVAVVRLRRKAF